MPIAINPNQVLQSSPPRPNVCLKGKLMREVTIRAKWKLCKRPSQ